MLLSLKWADGKNHYSLDHILFCYDHFYKKKKFISSLVIKSPLTTKILQQQKKYQKYNTEGWKWNYYMLCSKNLRSFTMWIQLRGPLFFFNIVSETFELKAKIYQCQKVIKFINSCYSFIQILQSGYMKSNWFDD